MASIVTLDTYNEVGNKHLKLLNGEAARRLSVGSGWTKLAIGFRMMMSREIAGDITGAPRFVFGLSAGPTTPWSNGANALGFRGSVSTYSDNVPDADGQGYYNSGAMSYDVELKRNGASIVDTSTILSPSSESFPNDRGTARFLRTIIGTVQKGSPNWYVNMVIQLPNSGSFDSGHRTKEQLITALEQMNETGAVTSLGTSFYSMGTAQILGAGSVAESTYGYLDSVFFSWDRSNPAGVLISDVFVAKWA